LDLYTNFVKDFESKIDQIILISIANSASDQFTTCDEQVAFLESVHKRLQDEQAKAICRLKIGLHYLNAGRQD